MRPGASGQTRAAARRGCSTKFPARLGRDGDGDDVWGVGELTERASVAMDRVGEPWNDEDADGRLGLGFRGGASVLAAPVLLFVDGVYRAYQGTLLELPGHSTVSLHAWINGTWRRPTVAGVGGSCWRRGRGGAAGAWGDLGEAREARWRR